MEDRRNWWVSIGSGLGCLTAIMILAWGAICYAHEPESAPWVHLIMAIVTAVVIGGFLIASVQMIRRTAAKR